MPQVNESTQVGVVDSWEPVLANVDSGNTPFISMLPKVKKTSTDRITHSQVEQYPHPSTEGVPDSKDATEPESNGRDTVDSVMQKSWHQPATSDISQEMDVHAVTDEQAHQIATWMTVLKRSMEASCLSDHEARDYDNIGNDEGYKTRGAYKWLESAAQTIRPVPEDFRPGGRYTGTLADFDQGELKSLMETAALERKGKADMIGLVGLKLKGKIATFLRYQDDVASRHGIMTTNIDASAKTYIECVDRIETDGATIDLMVSYFMRYSQAKKAIPTNGTDLSGLFLVKDMWGLDYIRAPRVWKKPYMGGGHQAVVDVIFMLRCKNPLGHASAVIDS